MRTTEYDQFRGGHYVYALSTRTPQTVTLDSGGAGELSNVQLYRCSTACASTATVVAWTHSGVQRYALVNG